MNEKIYCKSGGCSAKLGAKKLSHILEKIDSYKDSHVLVGFDSRDDAAVYQIDENYAFVSTLDFLSTYGRKSIFVWSDCSNKCTQ